MKVTAVISELVESQNRNVGIAISNLAGSGRGLYCLVWQTALVEAHVVCGRTMSPLVQRARPGVSKRPEPTGQFWGMLLFESLSAGAMAVLVGLAAVLAVVGVYVIIVWPLTFWDLTDVGLEKYGSWAQTVMWSVFAGGTLAGYWCFSGAAFKGKKSGAKVFAKKSPRRTNA